MNSARQLNSGYNVEEPHEPRGLERAVSATSGGQVKIKSMPVSGGGSMAWATAQCILVHVSYQASNVRFYEYIQFFVGRCEL